MSRVPAWCAAALIAVGLTAGCGGSGSSSKGDAGTTAPTQICTPNQATCVNNSTATICTANGLALVPVQCGVGQKCTAGACAADPNAPCTATDNTCTDSTHALLCTKQGAMSSTCPTGTVCQGPGVCVGACTVGSSDCDAGGNLVTCTDGKTFTTTTCGTGTACVQTGSTPYDTAACMPASCTPDPNGCEFVCGDKTGGSGTTTNTMSTCIATPTGFQWAAVTCAAPQVCNSSAGGSCGHNQTYAGCASQCHPGDTRCVSDAGYQTCGADGNWGTTTTACNADVTQAQYLCFANTAGQAVCGDTACTDGHGGEVAQGQGACDSNGQFHLCGPDGKVSGDVTACAGQCVVTGHIPGEYQPGTCQQSCQNGAQQCLGSGSYQVCTNNEWGPAVACTTGNCLSTTPPTGIQMTYCGVCIPGTHKCDGGTNIQTCGTDATWGADTACAMGTCNNFGGDAACLADCFPGKTVCTGTTVQVPGVGVWATNAQGTCTATGTIPTTGTATCMAGSYCRTGPSRQAAYYRQPGNGASYGCVVCVGTQNEYGIADTRCENVGDTGSGSFVEQCTADNTAWNTAGHTDCSATSQSCVSPSTQTPPYIGTYCRSLWFGLFTQSNLEHRFGVTCEQAHQGAPVSCGVLPQDGGGTVPDCCSNDCTGSAPTPAYCD